MSDDAPGGGSASGPAHRLRIRPMVRDEVDVLVDWAADEGWDPGLHDAEVFWATDPEGWIAAELDGELIGGGSIVAYGTTYGFMGFFIVRPDHRGRGLGRELWFARRSLLLDRLGEGATIEMDGVFAMQPFYATGGFVAQHRDLRFAGVADGIAPQPAGASGVEVVDAAAVPFELVEAYDRAHFPAPRPAFLRRWLALPGGQAVVAVAGDRCRGYAVRRPTRAAHKVGPLFADAPEVAESLLAAVTAPVAGAEVLLDVPERNAAGLALAGRHGMREVFGCARMALGPPPPLPWDEVFGVTTFELG